MDYKNNLFCAKPQELMTTFTKITQSWRLHTTHNARNFAS